MWRSTYILRGLYETPTLPVEDDASAAVARLSAGAIFDAVRRAGRTLLTEFESKQLLNAYKIPTIPTKVARHGRRGRGRRLGVRVPGRAETPFRDDHA